jgi:RNA polymerase sigma factor (sigma-70 family)
VGNNAGKIPAHYADELGRFYEAHVRWLSGHAFLRTQRDRELAAARELAADLVQDTFEAAAAAWGTLRCLTLEQQRAWLGKTLRYKETSHFRRRVAFRVRLPELHRRHQAVEPDPEQQALSGLALERAAKIIEDLPTRQKRIVLMKWNDHMKESDIAAELGCSKGTVAAEVQKIRRKLIDGLGPYYPFGGDDGEGGAS